MNRRSGAVVLLSGGLDSCVALSKCIADGEKPHALFINYNQLNLSQEFSASRAQAKHFNVHFESVKIEFLSKWSNSALFSKQDLPLGKSLSGDEATNSASAVWVPARNAIFVTIAAAYAESKDLSKIIIGCNSEEGATFKDNSPEFVDSATSFLKFSTQNEVSVEAPLVHLDKKGIIECGINSKAPFELVWSCYASSERMCGECESCLRLKRALSSCGIESSGIQFLR